MTDHDWSALACHIVGAPPMASKREQARRWAREAMEELGGTERVALACAQLPELTPEDLDELARRCGDAGEGRQHTLTGRRPVNLHE